MRGPFGSGFPLEQMLGRDLLLVAGGLGLITLRSLLLAVLGRRREFGRVTLLYGARDIGSFLFRDDLLAWHRGGEIDCRYAAAGGGEWGVTRGEVPHLFRDLELAPHRTVAAVSGPAGMYRFVNPLLFRLGFASYNFV